MFIKTEETEFLMKILRLQMIPKYIKRKINFSYFKLFFFVKNRMEKSESTLGCYFTIQYGSLMKIRNLLIYFLNEKEKIPM